MSIEYMPYDEKIKCAEALKKVSDKEYSKGEKLKIKGFYKQLSEEISKDLNFEKEKHTSINKSIDNPNEPKKAEYTDEKDSAKIQENLLKLYFDNKITYQNVNNTKQMMYSRSKNISNERARND